MSSKRLGLVLVALACAAAAAQAQSTLPMPSVQFRLSLRSVAPSPGSLRTGTAISQRAVLSLLLSMPVHVPAITARMPVARINPGVDYAHRERLEQWSNPLFTPRARPDSLPNR